MSEEEINKIIEVYDEVIVDLQQENSQLKEKVNILNQYKLMCNAHFGTKVNPIQQTQRLKQLEYENSQLKERIEKAIEYIENDLQSFLYSIEYKKLLEILKGDK